MDSAMIKIMLILKDGPAAKEDVYVESQPITRRTFDRKIQKLVESGFIKQRKYLNFDRARYQGEDLPILILRPIGADFLCNQFHTLNREFLRTAEPSLKNLMHDLYVARAYRKIISDSEQGMFRIIQLKDEARLRQEYGAVQKKNSLKGLYLPDMLIQPEKNGYRQIMYFEVDNGSKPMNYWSKKIGSWTHGNPLPDILIIAINPNRLGRLIEALKQANVKGRIQFIPFDQFIKDGLAFYIFNSSKHQGLWFYNHATNQFFWNC